MHIPVAQLCEPVPEGSDQSCAGELTLTTSVRETLCLTVHTISTVDIEVRSKTAPSAELWLHTRLHEGWLEVRMLIGIERLVIRRKRHKL
jgi:hypothetical protein